MATFLGYIGTCFMIAFAYTMVIPFAIIGLTLMTFQLVKASLWNLVFLNIVSIIGFSSNYFT
jgi:hypothetical protein